MSVRAFLLLVIGVPLLVLTAAALFRLQIPLPELGRDYVMRFDVDLSGRALDMPEIAGPADPERPLLVIDPGHGGRDPGSVGQGVREKEIVLDIALRLRELLVEEGGIRVAMTREDDVIVPLEDRPEMARRLGADLFLSIHADSAGEYSDVSGASIYTLSSEASSEAAARFAARENNADRLNGVRIEDQSDDVSAILVELAQERTQDRAEEFARLIAREGEGQIVFHPQRQRSAAFVVLQAPDVPGVLFESGFVTNLEDRALLESEEGRENFAQVLARAVRIYFARRSAAGGLE